jgi:hypothetical protein
LLGQFLIRRGGQTARGDGVVDRDVACLEHFLVEFFLLEFCKFFVEFVFVDAVGGDAAGDGFADFFADGVLFAETFPVWTFMLARVGEKGEGGDVWEGLT